MRFANVSGRAAVVIDSGAVDVEKASDGRFPADPHAIFQVWEEFRTWADGVDKSLATPFDVGALQPPSPTPAQVFAIGLNYRDHAAESKFEVPSQFPPVFTRFRTALAGAYTTVELPEGNVDWEVELVAVIGRHAHRVRAEEAWTYVAGLAVGQDISERISQLAGPAPQFSLGKSYPGFAPFGPWLVTPDEFDNPDDIEIECSVDGEVVQHGSTRDLVFSVPQLIEGLSTVTPLLPGDIIFTGTPSGVGLGRTPQRFLQPGEELVSFARGIGELRQRFVRA